MWKSRIIDKPWKMALLVILEVAVLGFGFWIAVYIFSANEAIYNAIIILSIFAVGMTIILYGKVTRNRNLNTIGFAFFLFAAFVVIDKYEGFAVKISAFAALLVAFAAFAAIEENRRMRLERRQQEERDRKERILNTIITWGMDIAKCESESQISVLPVPELFGMEEESARVTVDHINTVTRVNLAMRYQTLDAKSEYIKGITKKFDKNFGGNLHPIVKRTANKLAENINILMKVIEGVTPEEDYKKHWKSLVKSAFALVKKADEYID